MTVTVTLKRAVSHYGAEGLVEYQAGAQLSVSDIEPSVLQQWKRDGFIEGSLPELKEARLAQGNITTKIGEAVELKSDLDPILTQETTGTIVESSASDAIKVEGETVVQSTPIDPVDDKPGKINRAKGK